MLKRRIILAAGGSGGHVFPAQALAETLVVRGWTVFLITDKRGNHFTEQFPKQVKKLVINISNPSEGGVLGFLSSIWLLLKSVIIILRFCKRVQVTTIVGFGGYPSATSMVVGNILRIPTAIHEQNSVLGRVNSFFQKRVRLLVFGINPTEVFARTEKTRILGNPIRKSILKVPPVDYFDLPSEKIFIIVVGGSQGANFISSIACDAIISLPLRVRKKIRVFHQCRKESLSEIKHKYFISSINSETKLFFNNISFYLNKAHLVISRSGASSLSELCFFGRPSILIPLPTAVGNHQVLNANVMQEAGASIVLKQNEINSNVLSQHMIKILENFEIANNMAISAKKLSKPDAADRFVDELENLN